MTNYVPITLETHRDKRWLRRESLLFAKSDTVAPLFVNDLSAALHSMPIAFIKRGEEFMLVVVMGLKPGQNLFVSDDGKWLSDYLPVTYRSSPFELFDIDGTDQQALCVDQACVLESSLGEPFYTEDGQVTETIAKVFASVQTFNASRKLTQNICAALAKYNLIKPWELVLEDNEERTPVHGLYQVDEATLHALSDEDFLALRKADALPVIYSQVISMQKVHLLAEALRRQGDAAIQGTGSINDTFDFGGLH